MLGPVVLAAVTHAVTANLDVDDGAVAGTVRITVENPTDDAIDEAFVWLYANRLAERPAALNDVNFHWVYPLEFDAGWTRLTSVRLAGRDAAAKVVPHAVAGADTLVRIALPVEVAPGERVTIDLAFETRVPERFGAFGCTGGSCVLGGGFYPMAATLDEAGWDLSAPPAWGRVTGTLALSKPGAIATEAGVVPGAVARLDVRGPYATIVAAGKLHETVREHAGVELIWIGRRAPPPAGDAGEQILPYTEEDYGGMVLDAAAEAVDLLAEIGAPVPAGTRLVMIEAPLRQELAQAQPGMVLVSDRMFKLFPVDRFRKFHQRELVRALYTEWIGRRGGALPPRERDAAAEAAAAYLLDLYTIRQWRKHELARDLLSPVSFVPAIDQLLYAPQVAFAGAYFGSIADEDRFRDDPRRFAHDRPRGFVYYEKLRDLLDAETFGDAMRGVVVEGLSLRAAAERASKQELGWFFRQWGRAYPKVNYAIGPRRRERDGAGGWKHTVTVRKQSPPGETPPVEPVDVTVVDGGGKRHRLRWDGRGDEGALAFTSRSGSVKSIDLDPRRRLVESGASESSDDPRFDDRTPPRIKFLYNGFGALLSFSDLALGLLWDFSFRRVHDTRNDLRVTFFSGGAITLGGSVGYSRHFGKNVTPLRRSSSVGATLSVSRLDGDFAGSPSDGTRASIAVGVGTDDRLWAFMPMHARGASIGARYSVTRFDDTGDLLQTASVFADATRIFTPADGHTIVTQIEGGAVAGDIVARSQLLGAGGAGALRGYLPTELFGRARLLGHVEWRGTIRHDLATNIGHWIVLRGVGAAVFTDFGGISSCDGYTDLFASQNLYANAGFGMRLFYDNFGVQQGMMALDFAVPLVLRPRKCLGDTATMELNRPPFMVFLSFLPPF